MPVVANGDIRCEDDVHRVAEMTGVNGKSLLCPIPLPSVSHLHPSLPPSPPILSTGVMSARGILENPAMYAGYPTTPLCCVQDWVDIGPAHGLSHTIFHHHLIHMLERVTTRVEKRTFNTLPSTPAVLDYLRHHYHIA